MYYSPISQYIYLALIKGILYTTESFIKNKGPTYTELIQLISYSLLANIILV